MDQYQAAVSAEVERLAARVALLEQLVSNAQVRLGALEERAAKADLAPELVPVVVGAVAPGPEAPEARARGRR